MEINSYGIIDNLRENEESQFYSIFAQVKRQAASLFSVSSVSSLILYIKNS